MFKQRLYRCSAVGQSFPGKEIDLKAVPQNRFDQEAVSAQAADPVARE